MRLDIFARYTAEHRFLPLLVATLVAVLCLSTVSPVYGFHFPWDQGHDTTDPNDPDDPGPCEGPDCENDPCNGSSTGSPVYLATGHFIWTETDVALNGRTTLAVTRTFNSHDPRVGLLGAGWSMSCDQGLLYVVDHVIDPDTSASTEVGQYVRRLSNGKRYIYSEQSDGTFAGPGLFDVVVRQPDGTARLERRDGSYALYSQTGQLLSEVDRNGNAKNYTYDTQDRLVQTANEYGHSLTYEYNANGLISIARDHTGREWQYGYDTNANLISVTDPADGVRQYTYQQFQPPGDGHSYSHLTRITDESGIVATQVSYNGSRVSSYTDLQNTYTYQYNATARTTTKRDSQGSQWVFAFDQTGQIIQETAPLSRITRYDRNSDGLVTRKVDPNGRETTFTYDQYGRLLTETDGRGTLGVTYANDEPWPVVLTTRSARTTEVEYDANGNPTRIEDPADVVTTLTWSARGDLLTVTNSLGDTVSNTYTPEGLILTRTDGLGRITRYEYDARRNVTRIINPAGEASVFTYDQLDRLVSRRDPNGSTTVYNYDASDRVTDVVLPEGSLIDYEHDAFGRIASTTRFGQNPVTFTYNSDNTRATITRSDGNVIQLNYDLAKRRIGQVVGSQDTYTYTYDVQDRLTAVSSNAGTVTYGYDLYGRLLSETSNGESVTYQYNNEDEITQLSALGIQQLQVFDTRGQVTSIATSLANYTYAYDAIGRMTSVTGGGRNTTLAYDDASQLTSIVHGASTRNHTYQYDGNRRIASWDGIAGELRTYGYDDEGRLANVTTPSANSLFSYDDNGNRLANEAVFNLANQLTENAQYTFAYDNNGNVVEKTSKADGSVERYNYNGLDQLIRFQQLPNASSTTPTADVSYLYGPTGKRWQKVNALSGATTDFYWSGSSLIGEEQAGVQRRYVLEGLTPIGFIENGEQYNLLRDHLGTPHEVTDSVGTVVWQANYASFGAASITVDTVSNNLRFPGQYFDVESGLHYNHFRDYDPSTGRYLQADPIGLAGGLNQYTYAANDPINKSDSQGLILDTIADVGFILYDLYRIGKDNVFGDCDNLGENLAALGADALGAAIPFASGGGLAVRAGSKVADDVGVIYRVPGSATPSGKPYVGRSDDLPARTQNARDGRDRTQAEVIDTYPKGDRDAARAAEQRAINDNGGVENLDNKRNEIAPSKWGDFGID